MLPVVHTLACCNRGKVHHVLPVTTLTPVRLLGPSRRSVVFQNPNFISYFTAATPEAELGNLNIGSRPARRKAGASVANLRAIPWIFAWTQTRLILPSWLGVGDALNQLIREVGGEQVHSDSARLLQVAA